MKKLQWLFAIIVLIILAVTGYLLLQNKNSGPITEGLSNNMVEEFQYTYMSEKEKLVLDCQFPNPSVNTEDGESQILIANLENNMDGYQLPTRNFVLALPKDTDVSSITLERQDPQQISNIVLEEADLKTTSTDSNVENVVVNTKEINYSVQEKEGCKFVIFSISPCEYIKSDKKVYFYPNIEVTILVKEKDWNIDQVTQDTIDYLKDMVDNPEMLDTYNVDTISTLNKRFFVDGQRGANS